MALRSPGPDRASKSPRSAAVRRAGVKAAVRSDKPSPPGRRRTNTAPTAETDYQRLFERSPIPMWVYDPGSTRFLDVNDAAVEHYGYSRAELRR
jgi:PAS domain-containing protein